MCATGAVHTDIFRSIRLDHDQRRSVCLACGRMVIRMLALIVDQRRVVFGMLVGKEFESTPGSLSDGANPEETREMPRNEINQMA